MMRIALSLVLGIAAVSMAGNSTLRADDKEVTKKLTGTLACGKCELGEPDKCSNVLIVKDGDKKITYFLRDKGAGEKYHACTKPVENVTVSGKVVEKDNKKWIEDPKVEVKK